MSLDVVDDPVPCLRTVAFLSVIERAPQLSRLELGTGVLVPIDPGDDPRPVVELIIVGRLECDRDHEVDVRLPDPASDVGLGLSPHVAGQLLELEHQETRLPLVCRRLDLQPRFRCRPVDGGIVAGVLQLMHEHSQIREVVHVERRGQVQRVPFELPIGLWAVHPLGAIAHCIEERCRDLVDLQPASEDVASDRHSLAARDDERGAGEGSVAGGRVARAVEHREVQRDVVDMCLVGELQDLHHRVLETGVAHREDVLIQRVLRIGLVRRVRLGALVATRILDGPPVARRDRRGVEFDHAPLLREVTREGRVELGGVARIEQRSDEQPFVVVDRPEPMLERDVAERFDTSLVQRAFRGQLPRPLGQFRGQLETHGETDDPSARIIPNHAARKHRRDSAVSSTTLHSEHLLGRPLCHRRHAVRSRNNLLARFSRVPVHRQRYCLRRAQASRPPPATGQVRMFAP